MIVYFKKRVSSSTTDSIPLDLHISSKPSTSPSNSPNSDSNAFTFPENSLAVDPNSNSIPLELPTFPIAIDESWGAKSNINDEESNLVLAAPEGIEDLDSLEEIKAQNLLVHSRNNSCPSYGELHNFISLFLFSQFLSKPNFFLILNLNYFKI